jgi:hypothetical protein
VIYYADTHPSYLGVAPDGYLVVAHGGGWKKMSEAQFPPRMARLVLALRYRVREEIDHYKAWMKWRDMPPEYTDDATICTVKDASSEVGVHVRASCADDTRLHTTSAGEIPE